MQTQRDPKAGLDVQRRRPRRDIGVPIWLAYLYKPILRYLKPLEVVRKKTRRHNPDFESHAGANGLDFCRHAAFGFPGDAFVALFGDLAPVPTVRLASPVGFKVVRIDMPTREVVDALTLGGAALDAVLAGWALRRLLRARQ